MSTHWFAPLRSTLLLLVWCALHNSVSAVVLVSGVLLALLLPWLTRSFRTEPPKVLSYRKLAKYLLMVLWDIVVANLQVVRLVLGSNRKLNPAFVAVPLDIQAPLPLTMLAASICLTPGTVSAQLLPEESDSPHKMLVHVLDLQDEHALIAAIKQRYEAPLQEIFVCSV